MRITETQLRRIVRQEILREADVKTTADAARAATAMGKSQSLTAAEKKIDTDRELAGALKEFIKSIKEKSGLDNKKVMSALRLLMQDSELKS
jgi:hypothetical protein